MNRAAYKTSPPSASTTINLRSYGGKHKKVSPYPYSKFVLSAKSVSQKKSKSTSVPFYLQDPSSITNSKGSLAEFAAQVQSIRLHLDLGEG